MRFRDALAAPGFGAIAEFKRRSPSAGDLRPDGDVAAVARSYETGGARAMSVLVDERFGGTWDDLRTARAATKLPLLAKGFFSTPAHLEEARDAGADAVLLLLRDLEDSAVVALTRVARTLGLDTLVEAHDADELARAARLDAPVIGVNARNLGDFSIDRKRQLELVASAPARPRRDRRERHRDARPGGGRGARRRERDPRRLDADARSRSRRQAARARLAPARQGVRADASGGRRRRGRGGRRHGRLHPRGREPAPRGRAARRARQRSCASPSSSASASRPTARTSCSSTAARTVTARATRCCCAATSRSAASSTSRGPSSDSVAP